MQLRTVCLLLTYLAGAGTVAIESRAQTPIKSPLTFKAGLGYEFLSQNYFLESVSDTSTDPLLDNVALKTTYLDNIKAMLGLTFSPGAEGEFVIQAQYEQTPDILRARFFPEFHLKARRARFDIITEVEAKERFRDSSSPGDSFVFGRFDGRLTLPFGSSNSLRVKLSGDAVKFDSTSDLTYDYYRLGGRVGWGKSFENFSFLNAELFLQSRRVSDSSSLDYLSYGTEGRFWGFIGNTEWDFFGRLERKDFNYAVELNDFSRAELEVRGQIPFVRAFSIRPEFEFELTDYSSEDPTNFDNSRAEGAILFSLKNGDLTASVGPAMEVLNEAEGELSTGEDYTEFGGQAELDYFCAGRFFGSLESATGIRNLAVNDEYQTDFAFERISLLADSKIAAGLGFNVLFSAEWEWHDIEANNSRILLLNSSLTYSF